MSVLDPLTHALAAVIAAAHTGLTTFGADPAAGATWLVSIAAVVAVVRLSLLPLAAHGVRLAHASARARPQFEELAKRYRERKDPQSLRALRDERRRIAAQHGVSRLGWLPLLAQVPIWFALYHLLADAAAGQTVGVMDAGLVASLGGATVLGVRLAERGYLGAGPTHLAVVAGLVCAAAALSYVTQRYLIIPNSITGALPDAMVQAQHLMPVVSVLAMLVAGGLVPVALLAYWVCNSAWTLGQSAVIFRWFPTPGSAAATRRATPR
jgi:YidC/Oxa1 family membrane protein insertase